MEGRYFQFTSCYIYFAWPYVRSTITENGKNNSVQLAFNPARNWCTTTYHWLVIKRFWKLTVIIGTLHTSPLNFFTTPSFCYGMQQLWKWNKVVSPSVSNKILIIVWLQFSTLYLLMISKCICFNVLNFSLYWMCWSIGYV